MCGICGYVDAPGFSDEERTRVAMQVVLRHRGPDGAGGTTIGPAGGRAGPVGWLGHTRLKILDLRDVADQPMRSDDGSVVLTYNGEIYNFRDLRRELVASGARFRSTGDTEVVLRAYEAWGSDFVARLDGMFALALWDGRTATLLLARDRTGKKPLFYSTSAGGLVFASEIKALLVCPWIDRSLRAERLPHYLTYGYVPAPDTLYAGIHQIPPASVMTYGRDGVSPPRRYWDALPARVRRTHKGKLAERVASSLRSATAKRMVSDVPLGALLSGGMDSSIVVALMSERAAEPVNTFSIGFPDDASFDEREPAALVARHLGTRHREFAVSLDAVGLLDRLLWHHDQPFGDSSAIPTYVVSRLAREHVTVVLNGDGGDEVFGGYDRFVAAALASRFPRAAVAPARLLPQVLPPQHGYFSTRRRLERFLELSEGSVKDRYQSWISVANRDLLAELLRGTWSAEEDVNAAMTAAYARAAHLPELDQILYANLETYLPDDLLVKMDRMSMANSLEARSPFLDTEVIELMASVPARTKVGLRQLKPVLRRAFEPLLPETIWRRKKHGFGVPMGTWFRGELGTLFEDEVLAAGARIEPYLDVRTVERLWKEHRQAQRENGFRLWAILALERWLRTLEGPVAQAPPGEALLSASTAVR